MSPVHVFLGLCNIPVRTHRVLHRGNQNTSAGHHAEICFKMTFLIQTHAPKVNNSVIISLIFHQHFCRYLNVRRVHMKINLWQHKSCQHRFLHKASCYPWCAINRIDSPCVSILDFSAILNGK